MPSSVSIIPGLAASVELATASAALAAFRNSEWFLKPGAYVLVDGQYGSTGKGLMAAYLAKVSAELAHQHGRSAITHVTTNAGPNSGHTAYLGDRKVMTQQLPVASLALQAEGMTPVTYLNGGAIIDPAILYTEVEQHNLSRLVVHPCAAIIAPRHKFSEAAEGGAAERIASTGKGVGAALAEKINREGNVAGSYPDKLPFVAKHAIDWDWRRDVVFVETAQGFSLGINSPRFYPQTTSRECTVMQAIADARIPPGRVRGVCATYRTFPIRVGNTDRGHSGGYYPDQSETSWEALGVEPELTSVTKRVRRVFTWSRIQFMESVRTNEPDVIFLNFMNYIQTEEGRERFVQQALSDYRQVMGLHPALVLLGYGPRSEDVRIW